MYTNYPVQSVNNESGNSPPPPTGDFLETNPLVHYVTQLGLVSFKILENAGAVKTRNAEN